VSTGALRLYRYPEFDFLVGGYQPGHCTLYERALDPTEGDFYRQTLIRQRRIHERTKKRFLSMKPEGVEITRRWPSGDEIHLGDAVDYCIDLLRGASPEENIYFRKVTNRRDTIAAVVVDASSSTDETVNDRKIIDIEKDAIAVLAAALQKIGDDFGVFSFFSLGRHKVFFESVKDFDEPWDSRAQGRIDSIQPQASNRDGCAIRHAAARLAEHPHATKLLLLLSDGIPADVGYGGASSAETSEYAIEDTRRAIIECRMKGIVPYCITIDRSAREYIAHLYGNYHYTVIDDVTMLPERLSRLYLHLTK
jgi:nitric oxide reductase activation protein